MPIFPEPWLVIFLLVPTTPQYPSEGAPATSLTSAQQSPLTLSIESQAKPSLAPTSRNSKSYNLIAPVKTAQATP
jgi:hypothetical protein